jgi:hypothetical protein
LSSYFIAVAIYFLDSSRSFVSLAVLLPGEPRRPYGEVSVIALWLGHVSTETTQIYLHADMQLKERVLAHATPSGLAPDRFRPTDPLLAFLESL